MTPTELFALLKKLKKGPKKRFSQNFLIDPNIARKIISTAQIEPEDTVLEIGPGAGSLTKELLKTKAHIIAVEIDTDFAKHLQRWQTKRFEVIEADFLNFPMQNLPRGFKVVANLPYHITTPIFEKLFSHAFSTMTIMVQKELGERIKATKATKAFGPLSLFFQSNAEMIASIPVGAKAFYPQPKVDSIVLYCKKKEISNLDRSLFRSLIQQAFQKRRKKLTSSLSFPKELLHQWLEEIGARPDARPEMLGLKEWIALTRIIKRRGKNALDDRKSSP